MNKTIRVLAAATLQAAAVSAAFAQTPAPAEVVRVCPRGGSNAGDVVLWVEGSNFTAGTQVGLRDVQGAFTSLAVAFVHSGLVQAVVPAGTTPGVYSVEVDNGVRPSDILRDCYTVSDGTSFADSVPIPGPGSGYQLRSVPQYCTVQELLSVLENALGPYNPALYRVLIWRGGRYRDLVELPGHCDLSGESFWALGKAATVLDVSAPDCFAPVATRVGGRFVLPLEPGWNQISQPFFDRANNMTLMSWSDVLVDTDGALPNPLSTGSATAWIGSPYAWDGRSYSPVTDLLVGRGYFVYNRTPGILYLIFNSTDIQPDPVPSPKGSASLAGSEEMPPAPPPAGSGGDGSAAGTSCGLLGAEAAALLLIVRLSARRRRPAGA
ncbi:MAG TPA: hypothetical protein VNO22_16665 [Planctomycetota bacterium]|nr:hypothetical protein [Planctomycetota bacterium]